MINKYKHVVVGLGKTGLSVAKFLSAKNIECIVCDTRLNPPFLQELQTKLPNVKVICGDFSTDIFTNAEVLYVSPGVSLHEPAIASAIKCGVKISGDIDLFSQYAKAPIVAITGTNGKSTVTTLVGEMAKCAGKKVAVGGNLGIPILDLLDDDIELYVVEVSSFQLETTHSLNAEVATCLNIDFDHQDRYPNFVSYIDAKKRIAKGAKCLVINSDCWRFSNLNIANITFGNKPDCDFHLLQIDDQTYLAHQGKTLINVNELKIVGKHNYLNALAALALGCVAGLEFAPMLKALREFAGLEHRCQLVRNLNGVNYYNDSKATNVASCIAALESIGEALANGTIKPATDEYLQQKYAETFFSKEKPSFADFCANVVNNKVVLILGGDSKNADFSPLIPSINKYCSAVFYIGKDNCKIYEQFLERTNKNIKHVNASDFEGFFCYGFYKPGDELKQEYRNNDLEEGYVLSRILRIVDKRNDPNNSEPLNQLETVRIDTLSRLIRYLPKYLEAGNAVLFAPACASFDQFENFEQRGARFVQKVNAL